MLKRSKKFLEVSNENSDGHVTELRHLWRDVFTKAFSKLRELQKAFQGIQTKGLDVAAREEFSKNLSECVLDVRRLLESLQEGGNGDINDDPSLAVVQYQVGRSG